MAALSRWFTVNEALRLKKSWSLPTTRANSSIGSQGKPSAAIEASNSLTASVILLGVPFFLPPVLALPFLHATSFYFPSN